MLRFGSFQSISKVNCTTDQACFAHLIPETNKQTAVIETNSKSLCRRADELQRASARELPHDMDTAGLLIFYAAECNLKAAYMRFYALKDTSDARGTSCPVRDYGHRIDELALELRIPASSVPRPPRILLRRTQQEICIKQLHEAWRYGEKIEDADELYKWLVKLDLWARNNR